MGIADVAGEELQRLLPVGREGVEPPPAIERIVEDEGADFAAGRQQYLDQIPLKRFGAVEEVAACVLFLASKQAAYVTGTVLEVAGGL